MSALLDKFSTLATKAEITQVADGIESLREDLSQINTKLNELEPGIRATEDRLVANETKINEGTDTINPTAGLENIIAELNDRSQRARNVLIHNVPDNKNRNTEARVFHDKEQTMKIFRALGREDICREYNAVRLVRSNNNNNNNKSRPLKIILNSEQDARALLDNFSAHVLKTLAGGLENVAFSGDRTPSFVMESLLFLSRSIVFASIGLSWVNS